MTSALRYPTEILLYKSKSGVAFVNKKGKKSAGEKLEQEEKDNDKEVIAYSEVKT